MLDARKRPQEHQKNLAYLHFNLLRLELALLPPAGQPECNLPSCFDVESKITSNLLTKRPLTITTLPEV